MEYPLYSVKLMHALDATGLLQRRILSVTILCDNVVAQTAICFSLSSDLSPWQEFVFFIFLILIPN